MNLSVLQKTRLYPKPKLYSKPFPFIIIEDALPEKIYQELEETFPEVLVMDDAFISEPNTYKPALTCLNSY